MNTTAKEVADGIISTISYASDKGMDIDVDGCDLSSEKISDKEAIFHLVKYEDQNVPGKSGPGSRVPIGRWHYTVVVKAHYEKYEE